MKFGYPIGPLIPLAGLVLSCSSHSDDPPAGNVTGTGVTGAGVTGAGVTGAGVTGSGEPTNTVGPATTASGSTVGGVQGTTGMQSGGPLTSGTNSVTGPTTTGAGVTTEGSSSAGPITGTGGATSDNSATSSSTDSGTASTNTSGTGGAGTGTTTVTSTTGLGGGMNGDPVLSDGCGKSPTITSGNAKQINVGGQDRTYNIEIPDDYDNNKPYRLVLAFHGASLSANVVTNEDYYGLLPLSAGSTIFVAPQGLPTGGPFGDGWSNANGADVEFARQLIATLASDLCIDESRVFAEGFSMGGSMSYALACGAPDVIRGIAVHSGGPMSGCVEHDTPVAYFMTHGTQDGLCTYPEYGVPQLQDFAAVNGCTTPNPDASLNDFEAGLPNPSNMSSACIQFEGCMEGYPVRSCLFVGDHIWNAGGPNTWVPEEVWDFFTQF